MSIRCLSLFLMIIFSATLSFAQTYEEERQMEEDEKRIKDAVQQVRDLQTPEFAGLVESFLPAGQDAWTISLTRSGGFLGTSVKLIGLVNSEGTVACTDTNRLLPETDLKDLSEFILTNDFKSLRKEFKPAPSFCSDCYTTTLTLAYRNQKNKTRSYRYSWISLPDTNPEIKQFYEKVKTYAACG